MIDISDRWFPKHKTSRFIAIHRLGPGTSAYKSIISNNSYAHDEQEVNPGR